MIVYAQPGYAIDWSWSDELAVWTSDPTRTDRLVVTHRLDRTPRNEHEAAVAAARWWRHEGRTAVTAASSGAAEPEKEEVHP